MTEAHPGRTSRPALGFIAATALVVGNMIGSGLFLLPSTLAAYGGASFLGWGLSGVGAMLLALVFARLGMRYPRQGGPYAYARQAFGDGTGFAVAWSYWISNICGNAAIAIAFAGYFSALVPGIPAPALAICALWLCTLVNLGGARGTGHVQVVLTIVKLLPLVGIVLIGVWAVDGSAWQPFNRSTDSLLGVTTATAALTLWSFLGLECATIPAGEVRDRERTIPRATLAGTAIAVLVTIGACMTVVGLVPAAELAQATKIVILNSRADRLFRSQQLVDVMAQVNYDYLLLTGEIPDKVEAYALSHGVKREKLIALGQPLADKVYQKVWELTGKEAHVLGIGNIAGEIKYGAQIVANFKHRIPKVNKGADRG